MNELNFELLGRRITGRLSSVPEGIIRELFEHPHLSQQMESPWELRVTEHHAPPPEAASTGAYRAEIHGGFVMIRPDGAQGVWISSADHAVRLHPEGHTVGLELYHTGMRDGGALMVGMIEALRETGLIPLHTSIACDAASGLAFLGASGRGKTTTLLTAMSLGYAPLCEDFALFEPQRALVYGLDRGLRLLPDTLGRLRQSFPEVQPEAVVRGKSFVPFERLGGRITRTALRAVYLLERDPEHPSRLEDLRASERVMALFSASGVPLLPQGKRLTVEAFTHLAREIQMARLWLGSTPLPLEPLRTAGAQRAERRGQSASGEAALESE